MAEFQDVMEQFDRMCRYYQHKRKCPMACPMNGVNISQCRKVAFEEPKETEEIVMAWAAEHPVVYPTWWEWLNSMGLIKHDTGQFCVHMPNQYSYKVKEVDILNEVAYKPIPADIAQKLGIEPKEG